MATDYLNSCYRDNHSSALRQMNKCQSISVSEMTWSELSRGHRMLWRSLLITGFICSTSATEDTVLYIGPNSVSVYSECSTIFLVKGRVILFPTELFPSGFFIVFHARKGLYHGFVCNDLLYNDTLENKITSVKKVCGS